MTLIGHDRKYHSEQQANEPRLELLQSRTDRVCAIGCAVVLLIVIVAIIVWPGLVMH